MKPAVTKSGAACGAEIAVDLAQDINEATFQEIERAYERMLRGDIRYRFVIDMASLAR